MEKIGTIDILNYPLEIEVFAHRLSAVVSTIPDSKGWLDGAALLLLFAIIGLPIGFQSKFIQLEMVRVSWQNAIAITILSLFMPAASEELVFRGLLLPRTTEFENFLIQGSEIYRKLISLPDALFSDYVLSSKKSR